MDCLERLIKMTVEELYEAFENASENSKIVWNRNDLDAFLKLLELGWANPGSVVQGVQSKRSMISCAEHDEIWLDVDLEWLASVATLEDVEYLVSCNILLDEDTDSLHMFVASATFNDWVRQDRLDEQFPVNLFVLDGHVAIQPKQIKSNNSPHDRPRFRRGQYRAQVTSQLRCAA